MATLKKNASWFRNQLINKYMGLEERFLWWVSESKNRLLRIRLLFAHGRAYQTAYKDNFTEDEQRLSIRNWWGTFFIYCFELVGIGEFYQTIAELIKFNTRPLSTREIELAQTVFGDSLSYELIRWDKKAYFGAKKQKIAYVSFHTINSWGDLRADIFIHELVHVWQYECMGAVYIPRALAAQKTKEGYNYGGLEALKKYEYKGLSAFNLEQQADIIADYFRIKNDMKPEWSRGTKSDLEVYETYVKELIIDN
jgi:hypothetical protein